MSELAYEMGLKAGLEKAADEIERLREALTRIQDLTSHNMGMSDRDERCVHNEATQALNTNLWKNL